MSDEDPLLLLDGLFTVLRAGEVTYVASSNYAESSTSTGPATYDEDVAYTAQGDWTVTVGYEKRWWSVTLGGEDLQYYVKKHGAGSGTRDDVRRLAARIKIDWTAGLLNWHTFPDSEPLEATHELVLEIGSKSRTHGPAIDIPLQSVSAEVALSMSTFLLISRCSHNSTVPVAHVQKRHDEQTIKILERKLDQSQQALRDERHKYRNILASPSRSNRSGARMPGTPGRYIPSHSQSSSTHPPSSPSSRRVGPSAGANEGQSSDEEEVLLRASEPGAARPSQRTASIVNPVRALRAAPADNEGFLSDDN